MPEPNPLPRDVTPQDVDDPDNTPDRVAAELKDPGGAHAKGYTADPSPPPADGADDTYPVRPPPDTPA